MRFPRFFAIVLAGVFLPVVAAHADTITGFTLTSSYASGTVQIDTTTEVVEAIDLTSPLVNSSDTFGGTDYGSYAAAGYTEIDETYILPDPGGEEITIYNYLDVGTLISYTGGTICSLDNPCDASSPHPLISYVEAGNSHFNESSGQLSITPERRA